MKNVLCWFEKILKERFGHDFTVTEGGERYDISLPGSTKRVIFDVRQLSFTKASSDFPCTQYDATAEGWTFITGKTLFAPAVSELPSPLIECCKDGFVVHYDILGLTYWMLTRMEEVNSQDLDCHGRVHAKSSHAYRYGYLKRPIVDEWFIILGQVITRVWPELQLKRSEYSVKLSHDVDRPSRYAFTSLKSFARAVVGDLVKRKKMSTLLIGPLSKFNSGRSLHAIDPLNTFNWIMSLSEQYGLKSAFYFICGCTDKSKDADYDIDHPAIRELMNQINQRGHEIGLHPSYGSFQSSEIIKTEAKRLRKVCDEESIQQTGFGGRMHYLRWQQPTTMLAWENAGMAYDSTLGYAELTGFRCGTCFDYPAFDPVKKRAYNLRIRPLIAMETTVISTQYMGLELGDSALSEFATLIDTCRSVNGCFTLLWHNSELETKPKRDLYRQVLAKACQYLSV